MEKALAIGTAVAAAVRVATVRVVVVLESLPLKLDRTGGSKALHCDRSACQSAHMQSGAAKQSTCLVNGLTAASTDWAGHNGAVCTLASIVW